MALRSWQQYLRRKHQCVMLSQITQTQVRGWLAFLQEQPTATGLLRSATTVHSYARSARAFCQRLVRHKYLSTTPFAHLPLPQGEYHVPHLLSPEEWTQLLSACELPDTSGSLVCSAGWLSPGAPFIYARRSC